MAKITLGGTETSTNGEIPSIGKAITEAHLVNSDLDTVKLSDYKGHKLLLSIFPSVNTGVCATSVRKFNEAAANLSGAKILNVSMDLPFAQKAFCAAEGIENVAMLSDFRFKEFGKVMGLEITEGKFEGLLARAIVVVDEDGTIKYSELVPEIGKEPDYDSALEALA